MLNEKSTKVTKTLSDEAKVLVYEPTKPRPYAISLTDFKTESGISAVEAADGIAYDNASSGLTATEVQAAIDELDTSIDAIGVPIETTVELTTANLTTDAAVPLFAIPQDKLLTSLEVTLIYRAGTVAMTVAGVGDYTLLRTSQEGYSLGGFHKTIFDGWTSTNVVEKFVWSSGAGGSLLYGFTQGLANETIDWRSDDKLSAGNGTATLLVKYTLVDMPA